MGRRLIIGLGNVGDCYALTRHNVGFIFLDKIAGYFHTKFKESTNSFLAEFSFCHSLVYLVKPTTFMNNSGIAVRYWKNWMKVMNDDILVLSDDINLDLGKLRFRTSGGSGGHNGLKSIESSIGNNYCRLRIGIGNDFEDGKQADFVLSKFNDTELSKILSNADLVANLVKDFIFYENFDERITNINNLISSKSD